MQSILVRAPLAANLGFNVVNKILPQVSREDFCDETVE